jgi:hypothetical protein
MFCFSFFSSALKDIVEICMYFGTALYAFYSILSVTHKFMNVYYPLKLLLEAFILTCMRRNGFLRDVILEIWINEDVGHWTRLNAS